MAPPFKKFLIILAVLIGAIVIFSEECTDCSVSSFMEVKAMNLTESDLKEISEKFFTESLYEQLDHKFPEYSGSFKNERMLYNIRTKVDVLSNTSVTVIRVGFTYYKNEFNQFPNIEKDSEVVAKLLSEELVKIVKPYACRNVQHELCQDVNI